LSILWPEDVRAIYHHILEISDMLCFRRRMYSIFSKGPKKTRGLRISSFFKFIIMHFEGPKETRAAHSRPKETGAARSCIPVIFHIFWF
ncbi:hypothetical protein K443DRAFT_28520, partial [Laccaria amethystina LaAM-08-1]